MFIVYAIGNQAFFPLSVSVSIGCSGISRSSIALLLFLTDDTMIKKQIRFN